MPIFCSAPKLSGACFEKKYMNALQVVSSLVGFVVAGEAAALAIGIHIVKQSRSPWISLKNDLLLALDIVVGLVLILLAFEGDKLPQPIWFPLFVILGLITHLFRIWEYLAERKSTFCGNRPLFIVNNIKFIGLLIILVWGLII